MGRRGPKADMDSLIPEFSPGTGARTSSFTGDAGGSDKLDGEQNLTLELVKPRGRGRPKLRSTQIRDFIEEHLLIPAGYGAGQKFRVHRFQRKILKAAFDGARITMVSLPRGNGKSTFFAAVTLAFAFLYPRSHIVVIALTLRQAGAVYDEVIRMISDSPELSARCRVLTSIAKTQIQFDNGSIVTPISGMGVGEKLMGLKPALAVMDEAGFFDAEQALAITSAMGKIPGAVVIGIGTPGYESADSFMHGYRINWIKGEAHSGLQYLEWAAPEDADIYAERTWIKCNPAVTAGFLELDAIELDASTMLPDREHYFRVLGLGQWAGGGDDVFIGRDAWGKLHEADPPPAGTAIALGFDGSSGGSKKADGTALVGCYSHEAGMPVLWKIAEWTNTDALDYWRIPRGEVVAELDAVFHTYSVELMWMDPFRWEVELERLQAYNGAIVLGFPTNQQGRMLQPSADLQAAMEERRISVVPDLSMRRQFTTAVTHSTAAGIVLRKDKKRFPNRKDDIPIAAILAHGAWQQVQARPPTQMYVV